MTVKIALKKKFNKNAAACFYTEYAKSVTCKTMTAPGRSSQAGITCSIGGATGTPITWSVGTFEPNTAKGPEPQESGSGPFILPYK